MKDIPWTGSWASSSFVGSLLVSNVEVIISEGHPLDGIMGIFLCSWFIAGK